MPARPRPPKIDLDRIELDNVWSAPAALPGTGSAISIVPETLSVSSTNSVSGPLISHKILTSSDPGAAASILATDASGHVDIDQVTTPTLVFDSATSTIDLGTASNTALTIGSSVTGFNHLRFDTLGGDQVIFNPDKNAFTTRVYDLLHVTDVGVGASVQVAIFEGDSGSPAINDEAYLSLKLSNGLPAQEEFARITWIATDITHTAEYGALMWSLVENGSLVDELKLTPTELSPATAAGLALGSDALPFSGAILDAGGMVNTVLSMNGSTDFDIISTATDTLEIYDGTAAGVRLSLDATGDFDFQAGDITTTGDGTFANVNVSNGGYTGATARLYYTGSDFGFGTASPTGFFDFEFSSNWEGYLTNTASPSTSNFIGLQFRGKTSTPTTERSTLQIRADFQNILDGSRTSRARFRTAENGSFATAMTLYGFKVGIGPAFQDPDNTLHVSDAGAGVLYALRLTNTQTGTTNGGTGFEVELDDSAANQQLAGRLYAAWNVATSGSEVSYWSIDPYYSTTQRTGLRVYANSAGVLVNNPGALEVNVTEIDDGDSPYTQDDSEYVLLGDTSAGDITNDLPSISGRIGRVLYIKNVGSGTLTVDGSGAETIDGSATIDLAEDEVITIVAGTSEWSII